MPTVYHWQDTGSPGRSLTGDDLGRLKQILVACLVTGYAEKPGAGWTVVHDVASGFSLRNATGTGIINFYNPGATSTGRALRIYLLENATNTSGGILVGDNVRSGNQTANGIHRFHAHNPLVAGTASLVWTVIADSKTCILYFAYGNLDTTGFLGGVLYFGEDQGGRFLALGGAYNTVDYNINNRAFMEAYTVLRDPATGLIISGAGSPAYGVGQDRVTSATALPAIDPAIPNLFLNRVRWRYGDYCVDYLRGVLQDEFLMAYGERLSLRMLGLAENADNRGKLITVDGLPLASVRAQGSGGGPSFFITPHEDYW